MPLRRRPSGFAGLARIVVGQQVSVASAEAIWGRLEEAFPGSSPEAIAAADEATLQRGRPVGAEDQDAARGRGGGARRARPRGLAAAPAEEAHARLTSVKGIGPWTADIYLLFCLGHADIFPAGDLALRNAVAEAFGLEPPVAVAAIAAIAERWSPWRGVAAALFWAYYRATRLRSAVPV